MAGQAQAYYADGTPIPAGELAEAVAGGKAHFERDAQVLVRDSEGRAGTVSGADVGQLLAAGGGLETEETLAAGEAKKAQQAERAATLERITDPVQAYLGYQEAVARGATLGLSDLGLTSALGDEYRQGALARAQNPATAIPELGGAGGAVVASSLLGGAPGAAGGLARASAAGGRLLGAVGGAGEALGTGTAGALGLGRIGAQGLGLLGRGAAEGAVMGLGQEVSASSLEDRDLTVDKLMAAAGHGALMGGALNVAAGGGSKLLGAAGKAALEGMGSGKGLGESLAGFAEKRAFKSTTDNAVRYYNEATNFGRNPERINRIGRKLLDSEVSLTNPTKAARAVDATLEQNGRTLREIADTLDAQGVKVFPSQILKAADEQIAKLRQTDLGHFQRIADAVEAEVKPIRARAAKGEAYSFGEMWNLRRNFDKTIKHSQREISPAADEFKKLRGVFDDALDNATSARPELTPQWLKAKEDFSDFRIVRDALADKAIRGEKNRYASPSDYFSGGMAFLSAVASGGSALGSLATAAATGMVHKQLREKGPGAIARIADTISKLDGRTNKAIAAAIEGKVKDLPELPKRTIPLLAALEMPEGSGQLRTASAQKERYEQTLRLVRDIASPQPSPEAAKRLGNATAKLAEDFPELASLLHQRVIAAAQALNARAPIPMRRQQSLQPHLEDERVPAGLIAKWLREVDGVDMPESIWHDMARGRVPREKIEIIKETQPYLFQDWRMRVMKYVSEKPEKLSRPQRIRLSLAFDFTGDPTLEPGFIAQVQSEYAQEREAEQQQPAAPQPTNLSSETADDMKPATEQSFLQTG